MTAATASVAAASAPAARRRLDRDDVLMRAGICLLILWMLVTLVLPLWTLLSKSFQNQNGEFVGLANYIHYFSTPSLFDSVWNSLFISVVFHGDRAAAGVRLRVRAAADLHALEGPLPGARAHPDPRALAAAGDLAHLSLRQPGISQGTCCFGGSIYGAGGIIVSQVFYCFPHALMILVAALSMADARLYEAADALGASKTRMFFTVTLPGAKYGVISAGFVIFTLVITDFGIAKVIGGQVQRARHRHLQAGDRPAELRDGRGRRLRPADPGSGRVRRRPHHRAPAGGARVGARRAARAAGRRRAATGCCSRSARRRRPDLRHPRDGGVGFVRHALAVQPLADAEELRVRRLRHQRVERVLEFRRCSRPGRP